MPSSLIDFRALHVAYTQHFYAKWRNTTSNGKSATVTETITVTVSVSVFVTVMMMCAKDLDFESMRHTCVCVITISSLCYCGGVEGKFWGDFLSEIKQTATLATIHKATTIIHS